jgi:3-deoxy-D-manno-octulosonate 8-phosphate phosphatase (KDO 8-P phosphatase)
MTACGCGAAPSDSVDEVLQIADYVCTKQGGKGCVRECLEMVMKAQNEWHLDVQVYEKKF